MLCFWQLEITTKRNLSRALAEMNATGVVYTPGVCRGQTALTHTFWGALYTDQRGYSLCSFTGWAVVSLELRNGQMRIPRFLYAVHYMLDPSGAWVSVRLFALLTDPLIIIIRCEGI